MSSWTPGPWHRTNYVRADYLRSGGEWACSVIHDGGPDVDDCDTNDAICETGGMATEADAQLIALAPEMAEAILSLEKLSCPTHTRLFGNDGFETFSASCVECGVIRKVRMLAAELRAIGGDNE